MIAQEVEPLSAATARLVLLDAWPSSEPVTTTFLTGTTIITTIWQFEIVITITTNPVIYGEVAGSSRMSFTFKPVDSKPVPIKGGTTTELAVVVAFVRYCKMYLNGIVSAIERAGEEKKPELDANIFK